MHWSLWPALAPKQWIDRQQNGPHSMQGGTHQETPPPVNIDPVPIDNGTPNDAKVWETAQKLTNGRAPGSSGMHAKDIKRWLHGMRLEKDPESGTGNKNAGDNWRLFLKLAQAVWDHGYLPPQLLWVIFVLIPKGDGNFRGIGL
jgi:hypothetical protein